MNTPEDRKITFMEIEATHPIQPQAMRSHLTAMESVESGSLEKIRDILFGNQIREYEKRFSHLEERLVKEQGNLREEIRKRLDTLENYIKSEVESLTERVNNEPNAREEAVKELNQELKNLINSLDKKITQLDQQTNQAHRELRQQILEQSKNLDDEIRQKNEEVLTTLEREALKLRSDKTDRSVLAGLFAELAVRLNNQ